MSALTLGERDEWCLPIATVALCVSKLERARWHVGRHAIDAARRELAVAVAELPAPYSEPQRRLMWRA